MNSQLLLVAAFVALLRELDSADAREVLDSLFDDLEDRLGSNRRAMELARVTRHWVGVPDSD